MQQNSINGSETLRREIDRLGCDYKVIGSQPHNREILLVKVGGESDSLQPILITGGAHTDEPAGILAAYELISRIESKRTVYIIPCRDPLGFDGFRRNLQFEMNSDEPLGDWNQLRSVLLQGEVLYHDDELVISLIGEMVFTVFPPREKSATYFRKHYWPMVYEKDPAIIDRIKLRRFVVPGDRLYYEEWDDFGPAGATRYMIDGGGVRCPDTVIGTIPPPIPSDVQQILDTIDALKPAMTLDLHEGGSNGYYMFADSPATDMEIKIAHAMSAGVAAAGCKVTTPEEVIAYWTKYFGPEVPKMYKHLGASAWSSAWKGRTLAGYARKYGDVMVTETGRDQPLQNRVKAQIHAVLGAIEAFNSGA